MDPFTLQLSSGIVVSPELSEKDAAACKGLKARDVGNGYIWYECKESNCAGEQVFIGLCFYQGVFKYVSIQISAPELGSYAKGWSWSNEIERVERTKKWFERVGFPVGKYKWGTVWASYDEKSAYGSGGVNYIL